MIFRTFVSALLLLSAAPVTSRAELVSKTSWVCKRYYACVAAARGQGQKLEPWVEGGGRTKPAAYSALTKKEKKPRLDQLAKSYGCQPGTLRQKPPGAPSCEETRADVR